MNTSIIAAILIVIIAAGMYIAFTPKQETLPICSGYADCAAKASLENNATYCQYLDTLGSGTSKDSCYLKLATENGNASYCTIINNAETTDDCYYRVSMCSEQDKCNMISMDSIRKRVCYVNLVALGKNPEDICDPIPTSMPNATIGNMIHDACYFEAASAANDYNACKKILNMNIRDDCILRLVRKNEATDVTRCNIIENTTIEADCIKEVNESSWKLSDMTVPSSSSIKEVCNGL